MITAGARSGLASLSKEGSCAQPTLLPLRGDFKKFSRAGWSIAYRVCVIFGPFMRAPEIPQGGCGLPVADSTVVKLGLSKANAFIPYVSVACVMYA